MLAAALVSAPAGAEPPAVVDTPPPFWEDALPPAPSLAERLEEIRRRVQEAVVYPPRARSNGITGVTRIRFQIAANGFAAEIRTVETSGSALLDRAAEQGAVDAGELPRVYGRVEVPVRFELLRKRE
jgi:TonB family protein